MRIRILDWYIFREVIMAAAFAICAFSAVFIGSGTLFKIARYITDYGCLRLAGNYYVDVSNVNAVGDAFNFWAAFKFQ